MVKIGVISDTHGLMRDEALAALTGSEVILHAGDVGGPDVLPALERIAPVFAVRGNVDHEPWAEAWPLTEALDVEGQGIYLLHDLDTLAIRPDGLFSVVVFGHSHQPRNERKAGVLYFNPGSAGPRRFRLPATVGRLTVSTQGVQGEIVALE